MWDNCVADWVLQCFCRPQCSGKMDCSGRQLTHTAAKGPNKIICKEMRPCPPPKQKRQCTNASASFAKWPLVRVPPVTSRSQCPRHPEGGFDKRWFHVCCCFVCLMMKREVLVQKTERQMPDVTHVSLRSVVLGGLL